MVNNPTQRDVPAFYSPLTHEQHAQLGRIAILWGQIDMFVDNLLTAVLGIDPDLRAQLFNEKQIAGKLDHLLKSAPNVSDMKARVAVIAFINSALALKSDRNRCFHGVWGFRIVRKSVEAAAQHHRALENPFKAADLPRLERSLCQLSHQGMLALNALGEMDLLTGAYPLFHGQMPDQEWLAEWTEQHYADRHNLGRSYKLGRLPYLEHPLK
jgi:hypothetical protein